ncbi:hypothetical protein [Streptodolium elevatio]
MAEAIRLAQGTLRADELGPVERTQVRGGPPGARNADLIVVALPPRARITIDTPLPVLTRMDGDTIDGRGVELRPDATAAPAAAQALRAASSNLGVTDLGIVGFVNGIEVAPDGDRPIRNVKVTGNRFQVTGNAMAVLGATGTGDAGTIRDVTLSGNHVAANPDGTNAIAVRVLGSQGGLTKGTVRGVRISGNTIGEGWGYGIYLTGIQSAGQDSLAGGRLDDVTVSGNTIRRTAYDAISVYGGLAFLTEIAGGKTSDIRIIGNNLTTGSSSAVNLQAAYTFAGGSAGGITLTDVSVRGNTITASDRPDRCGGAGIKVQGTLSEANGGVLNPSPGTISGNRTSDVAVTDNAISGCPRGILVAGTDHPWPTTGAISDNSVRNVDVRQNRLAGNDVGLVVAGGLMFAYAGLPSGDAAIHDNHVNRVTVSLNTFSGNGRDLWIIGGGARDAADGHKVFANTVSVVDIRNNASSQNLCVLDENYIERSTVQVSANSISAVNCSKQ